MKIVFPTANDSIKKMYQLYGMKYYLIMDLSFFFIYSVLKKIKQASECKRYGTSKHYKIKNSYHNTL